MSLLGGNDKDGKDKGEPKQIKIDWGVEENGQPFVRAGGFYPANIILLEGVMRVALQQLIEKWMVAQSKKAGSIIKGNDSMMRQIKSKLRIN